MDRLLIVFFGGGAGALVRYVAGTAIMSRYGGRFPIGTLVINVSGSFLIGLLMTMFTQRVDLPANWRLALVTGFLGGYTTFSTFEWETLAAMREGGRWIAFANVTGSILLGYFAVWLGSLLARR